MAQILNGLKVLTIVCVTILLPTMLKMHMTLPK